MKSLLPSIKRGIINILRLEKNDGKPLIQILMSKKYNKLEGLLNVITFLRSNETEF
jgi:hypothetical protein